ncbi:sensor histidine kinase [Thiohalomonas denitrificans]|uniref:sensor histidine kinase n=1 Tax=Thiohalomonas denitrificans TaxID=415747 RepID=UPI0026F21860|nr:ATP-binding protein [Thiohalomonas denitrificans]
MRANALKRLFSGPRPVVLMFALLFTSLYLMSGATQNSATFGKLYSLLLAVNIVALVLLVGLILRHLWRLVVQYRQRAPGSRLTARLVVMFVILAVAPVSVVYYFALQFLDRGIDSWFDVRVEQALGDALDMGRAALDGRVRNLLRESRQMAEAVGSLPSPKTTLRLYELRSRSEALELTLLTLDGTVISSSSAEPAELVPSIPNSAILLQLRQGEDFAALEPVSEGGGLQVRIAVRVPKSHPAGEERVLHALFSVPGQISELADSVQSAFADYRELAFLRQPLKYSFILTLSLVLLLSLLTAVWAAFFAARRLVAPISDLVEGTRAVAAGDYDKKLPLPGRDELGFLVRSFNEMTRKIALARDEAHKSQQHAEEQRSYLETVLGHLSSGVLTVDTELVLRTTNATAGHILGVELAPLLGRPFVELRERHPALESLVESLLPRLNEPAGDWRSEVVLFGSGGRQVLMCRGSALPGVGDIQGGHVIVFDDVTALIQAQRNAAWAEVARRLAHEIKNPLTPIQLSAERLRRKYLKEMSADEADLLDRATHTIIQQVEAMKTMVRSFSEYAHTPEMDFQPLNLNTVVSEVVELYRGGYAAIELDLDRELPPVEADAGRLRQVLHNLIKNAIEAGSEMHPVTIRVSTSCPGSDSCRFVQLDLTDDGPGIPEVLLGKLFEPYVTTKPKGSGLGLAIVQKIIEEHGGMLSVENTQPRGVSVSIRLPIRQTDALAS